MCRPYLQAGKPAPLRALCHLDDYDIVATYGAVYRGVVQYYLHAGDVYRLERLRWTMETSLLRTLAAKHDSTATKMAARHRATIETPHGPRVCYQAVRTRGDTKPLVARCGGIPLKRQPSAVITDRAPDGRASHPRKELITRLLRGRCELCGDGDHVQVHHIARLADLAPPGPNRPAWDNLMARKRRKTLVVCSSCHELIHPDRPPIADTA